MYSLSALTFVFVVMSASATCLPPTTVPPTTVPPTTVPPTTVPPQVGCSYQGQFYPTGNIHSDPDGCYGVVCDSSGHVYYWDNIYCKSTTPLPTTVPPTTPPGCYYDGHIYPPGKIKTGSDGLGWCYGTFCTDDYQVVAWDIFTCESTSPSPPTTIPNYPTSFPPPRPDK